FSSLRFSNGKTAMLFSGTAGTVVGEAAATDGDAVTLLAFGGARRDQRSAPTARTATIRAMAVTAIQRLPPPFASSANSGVLALRRACLNFSGTSGLPSSSV